MRKAESEILSSALTKLDRIKKTISELINGIQKPEWERVKIPAPPEEYTVCFIDGSFNKKNFSAFSLYAVSSIGLSYRVIREQAKLEDETIECDAGILRRGEDTEDILRGRMKSLEAEIAKKSQADFVVMDGIIPEELKNSGKPVIGIAKTSADLLPYEVGTEGIGVGGLKQSSGSTEFISRLSEDGPPFKFQIIGTDPLSVMSMLKPFLAKGYPYPLMVAHKSAKIRSEFMEKLSKALKIYRRVGREEHESL